MEALERYQGPRVTDYGTLAELTGSLHLLGVAQAADLTFSSPSTPSGDTGPLPGPTASTTGSLDPAGGTQSVTAGVGGSGSGSSGLSAGATGSAGGSLPFTGFLVGAVAAAGAGMAAAGGALRRAIRRS